MFFEKHGMNEKDFFIYFSLKNYSFPLHFHRAYEIIYVHKGTLTVNIERREYHLKEKDLVFVFNNQIHEFKSVNDSEISIIIFSPELLSDFYGEYKNLIPNSNLMHWQTPLCIKDLDTRYRKKSFLYAVCDELVRTKIFKPINRTVQAKVVYKMLIYVEENYAGLCTLKKLALDLRYDYPYLSKLFVKQMNMNFSDYVNQYRISQACYQLKNSDYPIGEIAFTCGYQNLRTFHRNFHKILHMTPKEYRTKE